MDLTSTSQSTTKDKPAKKKEEDPKAPVKGASRSSSAPAMATIQDDDERLLARIGYKQVCPVHALNLSRDNLTEMIYDFRN